MYPRLFDSAAHLLVLPIFALLLFMFVSLGSNYAHAQFEDEETKTESERKNDEYIADQARLETDRREWKSEYFPTGASIMKGGDAEILPEDISAPFKALGKDMPSKEILDKILVGEIGKAIKLGDRQLVLGVKTIQCDGNSLHFIRVVRVQRTDGRRGCG